VAAQTGFGITMKLTSIAWVPGTSPDYFADVMIYRNNKPVVRNPNTLNECYGRHPDLVVLSSNVIERGYESSSGSGKKGVPVVELVLMDGSYTCCVARIISGSVHKLRNNTVLPGTGIRVLDHHFIWHYNESSFEWRTVMFIKDFEWNHPPAINTCLHPDAPEADSFTTPEFQKDRFDEDAISLVGKTKTIVPLNYKMAEDGSWFWTTMTSEAFRKGFWIRNKENKRMWPITLRDRKKRKSNFSAVGYNSDDDLCKCQEVFGFRDCVLEAFPVWNLTKSELFDQVKDRLGDSVTVDDWSDLSPSRKRWTLYWYYAVNIFCHKKRTKLPMCFVQHVRNMHPDPIGVAFTGYKDKQEE
jgi:hypothetical protein